MQATVKAVADLFTSKGTTFSKVVAVVGASLAWLNRQSYGPEVKNVVRGISFTVGGIPNLGKSGGTVTVSKEAGSMTVYGATSRRDRFELTAAGLAARVNTLPNGSEKTEQARREVEQADEEARQAEATLKAAQEKAAKARQSVEQAQRDAETSGRFAESLRRFVSA